ncbi:MAG: DUF72 domain-containing protein [Spirochaetales bacterium]|nr:DUF72 domain-containing protein [Spirochaetales bacterium]
MAEILIGTSGYYYQDWVGPFYPETIKKEGFFEYYSRTFPFCELNFSYYQMPRRSRLIGLIKQSPKNFMFSIKAHQSLTHERGPKSPEHASEFLHAVSPLVDEKRLAAVLLQFPYSFHYSTANRKYLSELIENLKGLPLAVEFRNREWMLDRVYSGLESRNACFVQTDMPNLDNLPLPTSTVTSDIGYIRFHGRNRTNWWNGDNTSRFDYLYNEHELQSWLCRTEEIASKVKKLFIAFNNHHKGQAVQNAVQIYNLLKEHTRLEPAEINIKAR